MEQPLHVLLIDDEPIVGKRIKQALSKMGFDVEVFLTPTEALHRTTNKTFEIVVTDIYMDEVDGYHVMETVLERNPSTKVIIITGYGMKEMEQKALAKGAFRFIAKPFTPDDLRQSILEAAEAIQSGT